MKCYEYNVVGCAFDYAPVLTGVAILSYSENEAISIPECLPFRGPWGENITVSIYDNSCHPLPRGIHIFYLSIIERKFYKIDRCLPQNLIYSEWEKGIINGNGSIYEKIIVGMSPYGGTAIWLSGSDKQKLLLWFHGSQVDITMNQFLPENPNISLNELCDFYINNYAQVKRYLKCNGLPPQKIFDNYMQQFTYRYLLFWGKWNDDEEIRWQKYKDEEIQPEFEYIEESLIDGTFDKLHDNGLLKYHNAGKPKKIAIKWHINKSEYTAYFWFDEEKTCLIFERFYGAHPDTNTDFIIRIDAEKKKYELALFRQGLKEPQIIPEDAYQLLVFKNKFEDYRSDNYNQERGAWIW